MDGASTHTRENGATRTPPWLAAAAAAGGVVATTLAIDPHAPSGDVDGSIPFAAATLQGSAAVCVAAIGLAFAWRGRVRLAWCAADAFAVALAALCAGSSLWAYDGGAARDRGAAILAGAVLALILRTARARDEGGTSGWLAHMIGAATIAAGLAFSFHAGASGPFVFAGATAGAIVLAWRSTSVRARALACVSATVLLAALVTRGDLIFIASAIAGVVLLAIAQRVARRLASSGRPPRGRLVWTGLLIAAVAAAAVTLPRSPPVSAFLKARLVELVAIVPVNAEDAYRRPAQWTAMLDVADAHPALGVGAGNLGATLFDSTGRPVESGENQAIELLCELGPLGLLLFVAFVAATLLGALRALADAESDGSGAANLVRATTAAMLATLVASLFASPLGQPSGVVWWFVVCGLCQPMRPIRDWDLVSRPSFRWFVLPVALLAMAWGWIGDALGAIRAVELRRAAGRAEAGRLLDEAALLYRQAAECDDGATARRRLGHVEERRGRYATALEEYRRVLALAPRDARTRVSVAACELALGRVDAAIARLADRAPAEAGRRVLADAYYGRAVRDGTAADARRARDLYASQLEANPGDEPWIRTRLDTIEALLASPDARPQRRSP